jgi:tetratricopeptide (TPR) repeat protein/peroxiredoxin
VSQSRTDVEDAAPQLGRSFRQLSQMIRQGRSFSGHERNCCFLNTGAAPQAKGRFANVSAASGLDYSNDGRGVARVDWDHDGDLDLWTSNRNAPRVRLLRNELRGRGAKGQGGKGNAGNHFLALRLIGDGKSCNRDAIGARVEVLIRNPNSAIRNRKSVTSLRAGEAFLSQSSKWLHFGFGDAAEIDKVTVHWPVRDGEDRVEEFAGCEIDGRFELVQGTGRARAWRRPAGELAIAPSVIKLPAPDGTARIPLVTLMSLPTITYDNFDGSRSIVRTDDGKFRLINLWASWCGPCLEELTEFARRERDLRDAGIEIMALSVDGLGDDRSDPVAGRAIISRLKFPFTSGRASQRSLQTLQDLHDLLIPLDQKLPVPASFLIGKDGRLVTIYKGRVSVDDLIEDARSSDESSAARLESAAPLSGRTIRHSDGNRYAKTIELTTRFQYATGMLETGRLDDAIVNFQQLLALEPNSALAHYNLATALAKIKQTNLAIEHYQSALRADPDLAPAHNGLADLLLRTRQLDKAAEHYRHAIRLAPENAAARINLGTVLAAGGQVAEAITHFQNVIKTDDRHAEAHYNVGAIFTSQEKLDEAARHFRRAIEIDSKYPNAHFRLGSLHEKQGHPELAISHYQQEVQTHPDAANAHGRLARLLENDGQLAKAATHYQHLLRINPNNQAARANLARIQDQIKR